MKNNAMFLLDLASSADNCIHPQRRSSVSIMPSLSENSSPPDCSGPFGPPPPFQCLQALGANLSSDLRFYDDILKRQNIQDSGGFKAGPSASGQRVSQPTIINVDSYLICCLISSRYRRCVRTIRMVIKVYGSIGQCRWVRMVYRGRKVATMAA